MRLVRSGADRRPVRPAVRANGLVGCALLGGTVAASVLFGSPVPSARAGEPLIAWRSAGWRYWDRDQPPPENWQRVDYDDSLWGAGAAPLGYGDPDLKTRLSFGPSPQRKNVVVWFRHRFRVDDTRAIDKLALRWWCDDGAVVFLNGREVVRCNLPAGPLTARTLALHPLGPARAAEREQHIQWLAADGVRTGMNILAIAVHQANPTSSDLAIDCQLEAIETGSGLVSQSAQAPGRVLTQ